MNQDGQWGGQRAPGQEGVEGVSKGSHALCIVTASMGSVAGRCTAPAACTCLRTLKTETPMGALGFKVTVQLSHVCIMPSEEEFRP